MKIALKKDRLRPTIKRWRLTVEMLEDRRLLSLTPQLLADLNVASASSRPESFFEAGGLTYFTAETQSHGRELWVSDGTSAGTRLVKDILPGPGSSWPDDFTEFQGKLYFTINDESRQPNLFRTDGTADGTERVLSDPQYQEISRLTAAGDRLYFFCRQPIYYHNALAVTDGTDAGTVSLWGINPDEVAGRFAVGERLVVHGRDLWITDGTRDGTIQLGVSGTKARSAVVNKVGYFYRQSLSLELWRSDGTAEGTRRVSFIGPATNAADQFQFFAGNDLVYFQGDDGQHGVELFQSDGTPEGTHLVRDVLPGPDSSHAMLAGELNGRLLVFATTAGNTSAIFAVADDKVEQIADSQYGTGGFSVLNGIGYYSVSVDNSTTEFWRTDGTLAGTARITTFLQQRVLRFAPSAGTFWFAATDEHGMELWRSDGTSEGTGFFFDIDFGSVGADPRSLKSIGDGLFYQRRGNQFPPTLDLWVLSPDDVSSQITTEFFADNFITQLPLLSWEQGVVFGRNGTGLLYSDGTPNGTTIIDSHDPYMLTRVDSRLYFASGGKLWMSDGTSGGTTLVKLLPGDGIPIDDFRFDRPTSAGGLLFFSVSPEPSRQESWRSDGTEQGTFSLGPMAGERATIMTLGTDAYFLRQVPFTIGLSLVKSDGTLVGTQVLPLTNVIPVSLLGVAGGKLYFEGTSRDQEPGVWVTDGTVEGTVRVAAASAAGKSGNDKKAIVIDEKFAFVADDGVHGEEIWISDGTPQGTYLLDDALPGLASLRPATLTLISGNLFFTGNDGAHGRELWHLIPGQSAQMVADVSPGELPGMEHSTIYRSAEIVVHHGDVYFTANDGFHGFELWRLDRPAGDTNFDGQVDLDDLNNVRNHFGGEGLGDADGDGDVDLDDLNAVRNYFGSEAGTPVRSRPAMVPHQIDVSERIARERAVDVLFTLAHSLSREGDARAAKNARWRTSPFPPENV